MVALLALTKSSEICMHVPFFREIIEGSLEQWAQSDFEHTAEISVPIVSYITGNDITHRKQKNSQLMNYK